MSNNNRKLIDKYRQRLQKLEERKALQGFDTPPDILIEIDNIEEEIKKLEKKLREPSDKMGVVVSRQRIQIVVEGDFSSLSPDRRSAAIDAFAAVMRISSQEINIISISEGSIVFNLGVSADAVQRLRSLLQSNDAQLRLLKVKNVILQRESGEIEEWAIKDGKFHLMASTRKRTEMSRQQWMVAHFLAGNLATFNVSKNLVLRLRDYLTHYLGAEPNDYLNRLVQLGDAFTGGKDEVRQRHELKQIVHDVSAASSNIDWPLVLSWTARLMVAYRPEARGRPKKDQEKQIKARIKQEFTDNLKQLEEPYYG